MLAEEYHRTPSEMEAGFTSMEEFYEVLAFRRLRHAQREEAERLAKH